jgi:membrane carboxypeptidase/penicillin-binding protein PbpC
MLGFSEKNPLVLSRDAAAKTGTTTDWHDNWTVGYTPSVSVGVWVGNTDNHPMRQITGVVGAAPIWHQFMEEVLQGMPVETFEKPEGIVALDICASDGNLPGEVCPVKKSELFLSGTQPKELSTSFSQMPIDLRNGLRATDNCPKQFVQTRIFQTYPTQVYSWAIENDLPVAPSNFSPLCAGAQSDTRHLFCL